MGKYVQLVRVPMVTREAIFRAVVAVSNRFGLYAVTVKRVASEAGCSESYIRDSFGSKKMLMTETYHHILCKCLDVACSPEHELKRWTPIEAIECIWRATIRHHLDNPSESVFLFDYRHSDLFDYQKSLDKATEFVTAHDCIDFWLSFKHKFLTIGTIQNLRETSRQTVFPRFSLTSAVFQSHHPSASSPRPP